MGFVPVAKNFREALAYSALEYTSSLTTGKVATGVVGAAVGIGLMHNDEHPVISTVGGAVTGDIMATAAAIAFGAKSLMS